MQKEIFLDIYKLPISNFRLVRILARIHTDDGGYSGRGYDDKDHSDRGYDDRDHSGSGYDDGGLSGRGYDYGGRSS